MHKDLKGAGAGNGASRWGWGCQFPCGWAKGGEGVGDETREVGARQVTSWTGTGGRGAVETRRAGTVLEGTPRQPWAPAPPAPGLRLLGFQEN